MSFFQLSKAIPHYSMIAETNHCGKHGKNMKLRKVVSIAFSLLLVISLMAGCNNSNDSKSTDAPNEQTAAPEQTDAPAQTEKTADNSNDTIKIALITKMVDSTYWQTVKDAAMQKANELSNVEVTHLGPATEADIDQQVQIVETCINDDYDGIILAACDQDALIDPVQKAKDAGIPVIMIDSGISEPIYDAFLATDNEQAGAECAKLMAELIGGSGEVAIINTTAGTKTAIDRETGFTNEIKSNWPDITIIGTQYCESDPTVAANQTTDFLSANPDLKGVWGANDQSAVGVAQAVTEQNKTNEVTVIGFDNSDDIIAGLESETIQGTAVQMPTVMGAQGVQLIVDILAGNPPATQDVDTGVTMVNLNNKDDADIQAILNQ